MATDLQDEDAVLEIFEEILDVDLDDMDIEDIQGKWMGYDNTSAKLITVESGDEVIVFQNESDARDVAIAYVKDTLTTEPEVFNRAFIESHIDEEKLKDWVRTAAMEDDYASEIAHDDPERFWEEAKSWGVEDLPEDLDEEMPEDVDRKYIEALKEKIADDKAENPMSFFEDIYGREEATKRAIEAVGIDVDAAASEAVNTDGPGAFLGTWDGALYNVPNDTLVYAFHNRGMGRARPPRKNLPSAFLKLV